MKSKKFKLLLITNAYFTQFGNQSFKRTLIGLLKEGFEIEVWLLGRQAPLGTFEGITFKQFIIPIPILLKHFFKYLLRNITSSKTYSEVTYRIRPIESIVDYCNDEISQWLVSLPIILYFLIICLIYCLINYRKLSQNIDLVWGYERMGGIIAKVISLILKRPLVTSFEGTVLYFYWQRYGLLKTFIKLPLDFIALWIKSDLVVMTDDGTKGLEVLKKLGHDKSKILFIPNGVDLTDLSKIKAPSRTELGLPNNEYIFVTASRLVVHKRIDRALILTKSLQNASIDNFRLVIIGSGPDELYLKYLTKLLDIDKRVIFYGALSYEQTLKILSIADMIWSFQDGSNLNNTIQDALALGKYVLTIEDNSLKGFLEKSPGVDLKLVFTLSLDDFCDAGVKIIKSFMINHSPGTSVKKYKITNIWTWEDRSHIIAVNCLKLITYRCLNDEYKKKL